MNIPLFIPNREWLLRNVHLEQFRIRLKNVIENEVPTVLWAPPREGWAKDHPFSPLPVDPSYNEREQLLAGLYWSDWLELLQFPYLQHFGSIPQLLHQIRTADFASISRSMEQANNQMLL